MLDNNAKGKNGRIVNEKCPSCGHKHMFTSRGFMNPSYRLKCSKCKMVVRYE